MELIKEFEAYLKSRKIDNHLTLKNYLSDIRHFAKWYEKSFGIIFTPQELNEKLIKLYEGVSGASIGGGKVNLDEKLSHASLKRHLSSLRQFAKFALENEYIRKNPFELMASLSNESQSTVHDPWHIQEFKDYLKYKKASDLTIKNYVTDVHSFRRWYESAVQPIAGEGLFPIINSYIVNDYKQRLIEHKKSAPRTVNRKLSSIRKFMEFAFYSNYLDNTNLEVNPAPTTLRSGHSGFSLREQGVDPRSPASLREAGRADERGIGCGVKREKTEDENKTGGEIIGKGLSLSSIEQEKIEIRYSRIPPVRLFQRLIVFPYAVVENAAASKFVRTFYGSPLASASKKLSPYLRGVKIPQKISELLNVKGYEKEFFAPREINIDSFPLHRKLWHHARHTRPEWYRRYHNIPVVHYIHFAILIIFAAGVGVALYRNLVADTTSPLFAAPASPPRILSFQGRLTDNLDNPITTATDIRFAIYDDLSASGAALLWQEVHYNTIPDQDGIFSVLLGTNTAIPDSVFFENNTIYLGVTIEQTSELAPRRRIASVPYAANSESLQGMLPITDVSAGTANVVLALDSSGDLTIGGSATPTFSATGGQFALSGRVLLLTTETGTDTNIILSPDDLGKIDLQKPLINNTNTGNISPGGVEVNDKFAVLATESAVAAFIVNNNTSGGDIFTASSSGTPRFTIANDGALTIPVYSTAGGIFYANGTGGLIAQTTAGSGGQCLQSAGGGTPTWGTCGSGSLWRINLGAISPLNDTLDLLVGSNATTSAKFAVLSINGSATPVASVSAQNASGQALSLSGDGTIQTTRGNTLTLGGTTTGLINVNNKAGSAFTTFDTVNSRVGIGTTNPSYLLDVESSTTGQKLAWFRNNTDGADLSIETAAGSQVAEIYAGAGDALDFGANGTSGAIRITNTGNVGIGDTSPLSLFTVGSGDLFQVNSSGAIAAVTGYTQGSGNFAISGTGTFGTGTGAISLNGNTTVATGKTLTLTDITGNNRALYAAAGVVTGVTATSTSNLCLISGASAPAWGSCSSGLSNDVLWSQNSGLLYPNNSTVDFAIGGTATSSADFAVLNVNGTGPATASVSGNLIVMPTNGAGGNVGIGTTSPGALLDLQGTATADGAIGTTADLFRALDGNDTSIAQIRANGSAELLASLNTPYGGIGAYENKLTYSEQFDNATYSKYCGAGTVSANTTEVLAPDGTYTSDKFTADTLGCSGTIAGLIQTASPTLTVGDPYSVSVWMRGAVGGEVVVLKISDSNGNTTVTLTKTWKRYVFSKASLSADGNGLRGFQLTTSTLNNAFYLWGAQLENRTTPGVYVRTTSTGITNSPSLAGGLIINATASSSFAGNVGIGTTGPDQKLDVLAGAGGTQLRLTSTDGSVYTDFKTDQIGDLTITPSGGDATISGRLNGTSTITADTAFRGSNGSSTVPTYGFTNFTNTGMYTNGNGSVIFAENGSDRGVFDSNGLILYNGQIRASDGNEFFKFTNAGSAVNELTLANAATGGIVTLAATGGDTDVAFSIDSKGADALNLNNNATGNILIGGGSSSTGCTITNSTGDLTCSGNITGSSTGTSGFWQRNSGALAPTNITDDLLLGATSTTSAKIGFLNIAGGTPTASISANSGNIATYIKGDGTLATTNRQSLTIGNSSTYNTTGNVLINPNGTGNVGIGTTNPGVKLDVTGAITASTDITATGGKFATVASGQTVGLQLDGFVSGGSFNNYILNNNPDAGAYAALNFGRTTGTLFGFIRSNNNTQAMEIGTAAATRLTVSSGGNVGIGTVSPTSELHVTRPLTFGVTGKALAIFDQIEDQDIFTASATGVTKFTISNTGALTSAAYTNAGGLLYTSTSGLIGQTGVGSGSQCLLGGTTPTFGSCGTGTTASPFQELAGAIVPNNTTLDFLIGGQATSSAKFGVLNINSGTPVASISANSGNIATYITGDGTLATTNRQSLTIGNSSTFNTTGNVLINPNGTGNVGIGTTSTASRLTILGAASDAGIRLDNGHFEIQDGASGSNTLFNDDGGGSYINALGGNLGIGTTGPDARLEINHATGDNLRLTYNDSDGSATNTTDFELASDGSLTLTSTGADVTLTSDFNTGINIGTSSNTPAPLSVSGGIGSNASFIVNNINSGDLIAASASGTTRFRIANDGSVVIRGGQTSDIDTLTGTTLNIGASTATTISIGRSGEGITLPAFTTDGGVFYANGSGNLAQTTAGDSGQCLQSIGGGTPTWGTCGSGGGGVFQELDGAIVPNNSTLDFLIGAQASTSAKFAVTGINAGTNPTASVSATTGANAGNGIVIAGNGTIQSLRNNTLTLGGDTTGNIILTPGNGSGFVQVSSGELRLAGVSSLTSTTEGTIYYDTDDDQLKVYANGKWQADRTTATKIVAANDSQNKEKADYVGDGTGDDEQIEDAIAALPSGGGVVVLLDGTYSIGTTVTSGCDGENGIDITKSNVSLIGAGRSTILQRGCDTGTDDGIITVGDNGSTAVSGVTIADLAINGVKATYTGVSNIGILFDNNVTYSTIRNTYVHDNDGRGIRLDSSSNNKLITGNDSRSNDSTGIYLDASNNNTISGNNLQSNFGGGINLNNSSNYNTIVGNNLQSNNNGSINLDTSSSNNTISSNSLQSSSLYGIRLQSSNNNNTIVGNNLQSSSVDGIFIQSSDNNIVSSNIINEVGTSDSGIRLNSFSTNNIVSNNRIIDTSGSAYGIDLSSSNTNDNYLIGNEISGAGFISEVRDLGTGNTIQHRDQFQIAGSNPGKALFTLDQQNVNFDIFTASSSSTTRFTIENTGRLQIGTSGAPANLDLNPFVRIYNSASQTDPAASISAHTTSPSLVVTNDGSGNLINASASGNTRFEVRNNGDVVIYGDILGPGADFAEFFLKENPSEEFYAGELVCLGSTGGAVKCDSSNSSHRLLGVVSDNALIIGGGDKKNDPNYIIVGLVGQVGVTVKGDIKAGDPLTLSSTKGVAVKAESESQIIGYAMEDNQGGSKARVLTAIQAKHYKPNLAVTIFNTVQANMVNAQNIVASSVQTASANVSNLAANSIQGTTANISNLTANIISGTQANISNLTASVINGTSATISNITVTALNASNATVQTLSSGTANIASASINSLSISSENVLIAGTSLRDYIASVVTEMINDQAPIFNAGEIVSPLVSSDQIATNIISPLADDGTIQVDGKLVIARNNDSVTASDSAAVSGDDVVLEVDGSASVSGNLASDTLTTKDATISGTLYAENVRANSIDGLDERIAAGIAANQPASNTSEVALDDSSDGETQASPSSIINNLPSYIDELDVGNLYADIGLFSDSLTVLGPTTTSQLTAMDSISVGTGFILGENSINTLGATLEIQSLRQGNISFMAGKVKIDTDGNVDINGNLNLAGIINAASGVFTGELKTSTLSTNIISPLPDSDLIISLGNSNDGSASGSLRIANGNNEEVLRINSEGDIISSGSATFDKFNLNLVGEALAETDTTATATGSAGFATLKKNKNELTIYNDKVTKDSLIYITPFGDTQNKVLYLLRQVPAAAALGEPGSFTVGISSPTTRDIQFNWLIVN